jgi:hypothetical protein
LMASFYTFMASAMYMFLKRFYFNEIIAFAIGLQTSLLQWTLLPTVMLIQTLIEVDFMNYYGPGLLDMITYP